MARLSLAEYLQEFFLHKRDTAFAYRRGYRMLGWTYADVASAAAQFARLLESRGVVRGDRVLLVGFKNDALKPLTGKTLAEVARMRGKSPEETAIDLVVEDDSRVETVYFLMSEDNVRKQIALPWVSFGSDAGPAWRFAEGTVLADFFTYVTVANPSALTATADIAYFFSSGESVTRCAGGVCIYGLSIQPSNAKPRSLSSGQRPDSGNCMENSPDSPMRCGGTS